MRQRERGVGESPARIFTNSRKEPNPTGSRPRDLIGLCKTTHENQTPEHARVGKEEEARKEKGGEQRKPGMGRTGGDQRSLEEAEEKEKNPNNGNPVFSKEGNLATVLAGNERETESSARGVQTPRVST